MKRLHPALNLLALALAALLAWPSAASARAVTPDGTLGTSVSNVGDAYTISGGTVKGTNLFHSFGQFNVPAAGGAIFQGPADTSNVISRVTGGERSLIEGFISTRQGDSPMLTANFFLINPSGITFSGPNVRLDVGGSFHASTADYIRLADGTLFPAMPGPGGLLLTAAEPQAFGFLSNNPASITVDGALLSVDSGQTLSLIGGTIELINGGILAAPGGVVQLGSVASPGLAFFDAPDFDLAAFAQLGEIKISGGGITVGGDAVTPFPNGTVVIRGGHFTLDNAALLSETFNEPGAPLGIDVRTRDSVTVTNGAFIQTASIPEFFSGAAADASSISIVTGNLFVTNGGLIESLAQASGATGAINIQVANADILSGGAIRTTSNFSNAGNITVTATGTITLAGMGSEIGTGTGGAANAGNIAVTGSNVVLQDGARIRSGDAGAALHPGDTVSVTATNTLSISGLAGISSHAFAQSAGTVAVSASQIVMNAGYITTSTLGTANAGQIVLSANTISLTNAAQVASSSQIDSVAGAAGSGVSISVNAPGSVTVSGMDPTVGVGSITFTDSPRSGFFSATKGSGNAGQISISTPSLTVADGGTISVNTSGTGSAGSISATVGSLAVNSGARIDSSTTAGGAGGAISVNASTLSIGGVGSGIFSTASSTGSAGQIGISAANFAVTGGGRVDSSTTGGGAGGAISVDASTVSIGGASSGLFSTASGTGSAGQVVVSAGNIAVTDGGTIDSSTTGAGAGGAINVSAASQMEISSGGSVRADSLGAGGTGSITIAAGDRIVMEGGSISTRAATSDGGNITLLAPNIIRLGNSQITTSVESGTGGGGNIFIDPQFVILNGSSITANAFGGPGGNITIIADNFLTDPTSFVQASSALSTPGTVQIQSPENNVAGDIAQLPRELVDASRLLASACSARRAGAPSSFTVAGRGGVPVDPDGYLPSFTASGAPVAAAPGAGAGHGVALAMAGWDCWR